MLTVSLHFPALDSPNFGPPSKETKAAFIAQARSFVHAAQPQPYICSLFSLPLLTEPNALFTFLTSAAH